MSVASAVSANRVLGDRRDSASATLALCSSDITSSGSAGATIGAISDTSIDQKKANSSQTDSAASAAVAAERNTTENSSASASQTPL